MRAVMTNIAVAVVLVAAGACSKDNDRPNPNKPSQPPSQGQIQPSPNTVVPEPGATSPATTMQDQQAGQDQQSITVDQQPGTTLDRTLEEAVHREIVGQNDLSTEAQSVQISVTDGVVTLQGPVTSLQEKSEVESIAEQVQGVTSVDNQLEVVSR